MAPHEAGRDSVWAVLQAAGEIVPWIQTGHTCGPDSRSFAPELELGGTVAEWARPFTQTSANKWPDCQNPTPFDTFAVASPADAAAHLVAGAATSRLSPVDIAAEVLADAARTTDALAAADA